MALREGLPKGRRVRNAVPVPRGARVVTETGVEIRTAEPADLDGLTALLTEAFRHDPLWRWAFSEEERLATWWRFFTGSALRYPCIWVAGERRNNASNPCCVSSSVRVRHRSSSSWSDSRPHIPAMC